MSAPDVIIVAGDTPQEVLGKDEREKTRLTVDGTPASLPFLREYFRHGRDARRAVEALNRHRPPFLSLNGPYLSQYLERAGFSCGLIPAFSTHREQLERWLAGRPLAVVISTTFLPFAAQIDALAAEVKRLRPDTAVLAGGIQVWKSFRHKQEVDAGRIHPRILEPLCEHNYLIDPERPSPVDYFIVNPSGEHTLARALARLRAGRCLDDLDNLAHCKDGRWRLNPVADEPPTEVRVDWGRYLDAPTEAFVPVQAGLGCGFRCTFCDFRGLRPKRVREPASIAEEIRTIPPLDGVRRVYFTDDNLFSSRRRLQTVCRSLIAADLGLRWRGMIRLSAVDGESAELMKAAGCLEVLLGIESGDAGQLRRMNKGITPERILEGIGHLAAAGIHTKSTFILGFPGETEQTLRNTAGLLNAYPTDLPAVHRYLFFTFAVLPLSIAAGPAFRRRYGLRGYGYHWRHDTMDSREAAHRMTRMEDSLKPELSPSYLLEVPEMRGLDTNALKRAYRLRNLLARLRRGQEAGPSEPDLWTGLENALRPALTDL